MQELLVDARRQIGRLDIERADFLTGSIVNGQLGHVAKSLR